MIRTTLLLALVAALGGTPAPAAAETVNCTAITSLPATLSTQGVYCLTHDLTTSLASGNAITVSVNNVTIDCNGYKLGGLAAGSGTSAYGIRAAARQNLVVRGCSIRGFAYGVYADGEGHLVEGNRFDGNTRGGVVVFGDGSRIGDNLVTDTGGGWGAMVPTIGIYTSDDVDVVGNTVSGVHDGLGAGATGIYTWGSHGIGIDGNRVRGVSSTTGQVWAIRTLAPHRISVRDNQLVGDAGNGGGLDCANDTAVASGNHVFGFDDKFIACHDGGGNFSK